MVLFCRLPITFTFTPLNEKPVNFNVVCKVVGKLCPLQVNIKSEGYAMSCAVLCEDMQAIQIELTKYGLNEIDFTEVIKTNLMTYSDCVILQLIS